MSNIIQMMRVWLAAIQTPPFSTDIQRESQKHQVNQEGKKAIANIYGLKARIQFSPLSSDAERGIRRRDLVIFKDKGSYWFVFRVNGMLKKVLLPINEPLFPILQRMTEGTYIDDPTNIEALKAFLQKNGWVSTDGNAITNWVVKWFATDFKLLLKAINDIVAAYVSAPRLTKPLRGPLYSLKNIVSNSLDNNWGLLRNLILRTPGVEATIAKELNNEFFGKNSNVSYDFGPLAKILLHWNVKLDKADLVQWIEPVLDNVFTFLKGIEDTRQYTEENLAETLRNLKKLEESLSVFLNTKMGSHSIRDILKQLEPVLEIKSVSLSSQYVPMIRFLLNFSNPTKTDHLHPLFTDILTSMWELFRILSQSDRVMTGKEVEEEVVAELFTLETEFKILLHKIKRNPVLLDLFLLFIRNNPIFIHFFGESIAPFFRKVVVAYYEKLVINLLNEAWLPPASQAELKRLHFQMYDFDDTLPIREALREYEARFAYLQKLKNCLQMLNRLAPSELHRMIGVFNLVTDEQRFIEIVERWSIVLPELSASEVHSSLKKLENECLETLSQTPDYIQQDDSASEESRTPPIESANNDNNHSSFTLQNATPSVRNTPPSNEFFEVSIAEQVIRASSLKSTNEVLFYHAGESLLSANIFFQHSEEQLQYTSKKWGNISFDTPLLEKLVWFGLACAVLAKKTGYVISQDTLRYVLLTDSLPDPIRVYGANTEEQLYLTALLAARRSVTARDVGVLLTSSRDKKINDFFEGLSIPVNAAGRPLNVDRLEVAILEKHLEALRKFDAVVSIILKHDRSKKAAVDRKRDEFIAKLEELWKTSKSVGLKVDSEKIEELVECIPGYLRDIAKDAPNLRWFCATPPVNDEATSLEPASPIISPSRRLTFFEHQQRVLVSEVSQLERELTSLQQIIQDEPINWSLSHLNESMHAQGLKLQILKQALQSGIPRGILSFAEELNEYDRVAQSNFEETPEGASLTTEKNYYETEKMSVVLPKLVDLRNTIKKLLGELERYNALSILEKIPKLTWAGNKNEELRVAQDKQKVYIEEINQIEGKLFENRQTTLQSSKKFEEEKRNRLNALKESMKKQMQASYDEKLSAYRLQVSTLIDAITQRLELLRADRQEMDRCVSNGSS